MTEVQDQKIADTSALFNGQLRNLRVRSRFGAVGIAEDQAIASRDVPNDGDLDPPHPVQRPYHLDQLLTLRLRSCPLNRAEVSAIFWSCTSVTYPCL